MKTAEQRVDELALYYGWHSAERRAVLRNLQEHARDQRHICAESVSSIGARGDINAENAHAAVINARAPGEGAKP